MKIGRLKPFVNDPILWEAFNEWVDANLEVIRKGLEQDSDPHRLYKLQGEARLLRRLKNLREEINGGNI